MVPLEDVKDAEFESDFKELDETDEEIDDFYNAREYLEKKMMKDEFFNMDDRKWNEMIKKATEQGFLKDTWEFEQILEDMLSWEKLLPDTKIPRCRSAFDTEFPSSNFRSPKHHTPLSPADHYSLLKLIADVIHPIEVGISLSDGGISTATWQFELRDLDLRCHPHAPGSIALLESSPINLTGNRQLGIPSTRFARLLLDAGLVCGFFKATWVMS
ncbi:hypothetical protein IEQ34_017426 [Dendrobium chrysotoxum]|uniref:Uncharacterized protein n=1 Tax=Dendrobium chrysotoxum TaxID=161865 RepID=A0AAV7GA44_DENCH|nr:hypothetical protein IEQ34_017426 [Dendrobium chrysotoxum]